MDPLSLARDIDRATRVATLPLGVKMLAEGEAPPERAKVPGRDFGHPIAVCQGYTLARRNGWTVVLSREEINCPLTKIAYGLDYPAEEWLRGEMCCGMYTSTLEAGARTESQVPRFEPGRFRRILAFPLSRADREPDVVVVYGNSAQVMLLLAASLQERGGYLTCRFSPRIDCSESVVRTMLTGEPQVILPCYGDRVMGGTEDHEMAFAFPWSRAAEIGRGLEGLHRGGVRYPIPMPLAGEPRFPPKYVALDQALAARPAPTPRPSDGSNRSNPTGAPVDERFGGG
jgi:uncharacterized protein (DUF169 family)